MGIGYIVLVKEKDLMVIQGKFDSRAFLVFTSDKTRIFFKRFIYFFSKNLKKDL